MSGERRERWYLVVVAVSVVGAVLAMAPISIGGPRMPKYWLLFFGASFALICGVAGYFIGNMIGSNGRNKAVSGVMLCWMLMSPLIGSTVRNVFGTWVSLVCVFALPLTLVVLTLFFRDWFRCADHGSADEADQS